MNRKQEEDGSVLTESVLHDSMNAHNRSVERNFMIGGGSRKNLVFSKMEGSHTLYKSIQDNFNIANQQPLLEIRKKIQTSSSRVLLKKKF